MSEMVSGLCGSFESGEEIPERGELLQRGRIRDSFAELGHFGVIEIVPLRRPFQMRLLVMETLMTKFCISRIKFGGSASRDLLGYRRGFSPEMTTSRD